MNGLPIELPSCYWTYNADTWPIEKTEFEFSAFWLTAETIKNLSALSGFASKNREPFSFSCCTQSCAQKLAR